MTSKFRFRLSEEQAERLRELTAQGIEQQEIARELGWHGAPMILRNRVYRWQKKLEIAGDRPGMRAPELTTAQKRQALKLITEKRMGTDKVAKKLGVRAWAVRKLAEENRVTAFISEELRAKIEAELRARSDYMLYIAEKYCVSYKYVRRWAHDLYGPSRFLGGKVRPPLTSVEPQNHFDGELRR